MNRTAVPYDVAVRGHELLERGIDVVEIDVGDEAIDAGVDAGGPFAMDIALRRNQRGNRAEVGEPARHRGVGIVAADALVVIALGIEGLRLGEAFLGEGRMLALKRIAERRPLALVLLARVRP